MNREDTLDSMAYWVTTKDHHPNPKVLGKVTAVDYTFDKDHSSACCYVTCNPKGSGWIDFLKKQIDFGEQQQRISFNSHYVMYVEEKSERSYTNHILYNKQEDEKMARAENEYIAKKNLLKVEQAEKENELKMKYDADLIMLRKEYGEKFCDLEKEKEDAEQKEKTEAHAKAVKEAYDAYIAQGFTKTQAETFVKICLENQST